MAYEGFEKNLLQYFRTENVDVHLYKFFRTSLYSADSNCRISYIGSPKTAWNEQVCAHQKLYRQ